MLKNQRISHNLKKYFISSWYWLNIFMEKSKDTGLRVNPNGSIRVNKSVFYSRDEVKNVVVKMKAYDVCPNLKGDFLTNT